MVTAIIGSRRVEAERVLSSKLVRNRIEDFLNLPTTIDQTLSQQERAATAIFSQGAQHVQINFVALVLRWPLRSGRQKGGNQIDVCTTTVFRIRQTGNTNRIDERF